MLPQDGKFKTPDTSLAAHIYNQIKKVPTIEVNEFGRGFFIFERSKTLDKLILGWDEEHSDYRYYSSYKLMLDLLHSRIKAKHRGR